MDCAIYNLLLAVTLAPIRHEYIVFINFRTPDDPFDIQRYTHEMNRRNFAKIRGIDINSAVHYRHEKLDIDLGDSLFGLDLQEQDKDQSKGHVNKNAFTHPKRDNTDLRSQTGAIPKKVEIPIELTSDQNITFNTFPNEF